MSYGELYIQKFENGYKIIYNPDIKTELGIYLNKDNSLNTPLIFHKYGGEYLETIFDNLIIKYAYDWSSNGLKKEATVHITPIQDNLVKLLQIFEEYNNKSLKPIKDEMPSLESVSSLSMSKYKISTGDITALYEGPKDEKPKDEKPKDEESNIKKPNPEEPKKDSTLFLIKKYDDQSEKIITERIKTYNSELSYKIEEDCGKLLIRIYIAESKLPIHFSYYLEFQLWKNLITLRNNLPQYGLESILRKITNISQLSIERIDHYNFNMIYSRDKPYSS